MKKNFYEHIVIAQLQITVFAPLKLKKEEEQELYDLVLKSIDHAVFDAILTELPETEKKNFLSHAASKNHDEAWKLLGKHVDNAEEKIRIIVKKFAEELKDDIEKLQKQ